MSYLKKYDILLVEDPFAEDDWDPCAKFTSKVDVEVILTNQRSVQMFTKDLNRCCLCISCLISFGFALCLGFDVLKRLTCYRSQAHQSSLQLSCYVLRCLPAPCICTYKSPTCFCRGHACSAFFGC